MKRILIINDDGIRSDGLIRLARCASRFGQVWVVAPDGERSACSHSITIHHSIDAHPYPFPVEGVTAWKCTGTPADCVRVGCLNLMPQRPDVVLSGINYGYNAATDLQYSATAGAAFEGAFQGALAIALSEQAVDCHEVSDAWLPRVLEMLLDKRPGAGRIWNVNFPGCPLEQCKGMLENRTVSAESFFRDSYLTAQELPGGGVRLMVKGLPVNDTEEVGTDFRALVDGYVSIGTVNNVGIL